jgi:hypothetical protein
LIYLGLTLKDSTNWRRVWVFWQFVTCYGWVPAVIDIVVVDDLIFKIMILVQVTKVIVLELVSRI